MSEDEENCDYKVKDHLRQTYSDKCSTIGGRKVYFGLNESMIRTLTPVEEVLTPVPTPEISDSEFSQTSNGSRTTWTLSDGFIVYNASADTEPVNAKTPTVKPRSAKKGAHVQKPNTLGATTKQQATEHKDGERCGSNTKTILGNDISPSDIKPKLGNDSSPSDSKTKLGNGSQSSVTKTKLGNVSSPSDSKTKLANGSSSSDSKTKLGNESQSSATKTKLGNGSSPSDSKTKLGNGSQSSDKDKASGVTKRNTKSATIPKRQSDGRKKSSRVNKGNALPAIPSCTTMITSRVRRSMQTGSKGCELDKQLGHSLELHSLEQIPPRASVKVALGKGHSNGQTSVMSLPPITNDNASNKDKRSSRRREKKNDHKSSNVKNDGISTAEPAGIAGVINSEEERRRYPTRAAFSPNMDKSQFAEILLLRGKENADSKTLVDRTRPEQEAFSLPSLHCNKRPPIVPALPEIERTGQKGNKSGKVKQRKSRKKNSQLSNDIDRLLQ